MHRSIRSHEQAENLDRNDERGVRIKGQAKDSQILHDSANYDGCLMEDNYLMNDFNKISSKKMERHSSPNLIARLMGLDTAPAPIISKRQNNTGERFHTSSSQGKYISSQESSRENKQFKDVYEVRDASNVNHKKHSTRKEIPISNMGDVDIHAIKHNLKDATSEPVQTSKEFDGSLEILDDKELLLEFLQDPNSLFGKHVHDLKTQVPTSIPCQITILKSSKSAKSGRNGGWTKPENCPKRFSHLCEEFTSSFDKPEMVISNRLFEEHCQSMPYKNVTQVPPTRIVVLKPNLHKETKMAGTILRPQENCCFSSIKNREFSVSGIQEIHAQEIEREREKLSDDLEYLNYRAKSSREIAKEITRQLRQKVSRQSKNAFNVCDGNVITECDRHGHLGDRFDEWLNGFSSSLCSTESSLNKEARRRLSERWKKTCHYQEAENVARGSSTLGDMLGLPNRLPLCTSMDSSGSKKVPDEGFVGDEVPGSCDLPLGISSNDGWIDGGCKTLGRSKSLSSASSNWSSKAGTRNQVSQGRKDYMLKDALSTGTDDLLKSNFGRRTSTQVAGSTYGTNRCKQSENTGGESILPKQGIHVNSEEGPRKSIHVKCLSEDDSIHVKCLSEEDTFLPDLMVPDREDYLENVLKPICEDKLHFSTCQVENDERYVFKMPSESDDVSMSDQIFVATEEPSSTQPIVPQSDAADLVNLKELEQPSPNSVLEATSEEESSSSGCFERISANLQELRMQLKLLKMESGSTYEEEMDISVSSDEESDGDSHLAVSTAQMHQAFCNEEDRDFSYLLDMLIESGIHACKQEMLSSCCYTMNCPVAPTVFDKLEKKYEQVALWSRSERKLLFDITNDILAEVISPCMDLRPWVSSRRLVSTWNPEGLVEALWQMVVKNKKYLQNNPEDSILEKRWLGLDDHVEETGRELEIMLSDDLLEELIADIFTSGSSQNSPTTSTLSKMDNINAG